MLLWLGSCLSVCLSVVVGFRPCFHSVWSHPLCNCLVKKINQGTDVLTHKHTELPASSFSIMCYYMTDSRDRGISQSAFQNPSLYIPIRTIRQMVGIPMGTNCAPLLADLFLYSYENEFLDKLIKEGKGKLARKFNLSYRYIDDLISFNNKRFKEFISDIYPKELTISETTESTSVASYLDLLFIRDNSNNITTKLYDKCDTFGFHIVNFPFMSSNIPSAPAYGVYASQLIHYARCCSNYSDFLSRHRALVTRLLSQDYKVNCLSNTFKKFYGRHTDLVGQYKKSVCQMFADSIS